MWSEASGRCGVDIWAEPESVEGHSVASPLVQ